LIANYWSPKPQSFYRPKDKKPLQAAHVSFGLGDSDIVTSNMLWNLLSTTSRLPFIYESGRVDVEDCPGAFPTLEAAKSDMFNYIGGIRVHELLIGTFEDFYKAVMEHPINHLKLTKYHEGEAKLRFVVRSRWLAKQQALGIQLSNEDMAIIDIAKRNIWNGRH